MPSNTTRDRALDLLVRLVSFDTESSKSNLPLIGAVADYCRSVGVPVQIVPNAEGTKAALFATIGPHVDGGIVLSGHTDCVPIAGQSWSSDPFVVRESEGRLYGRGTCDMKGFDAVALAMIPEFLQAKLERPIHILLSYDEEVNCLGSMDVITRFDQDLPKPRAVIVGEPTLMEVADSHKSVCTYRTTVHGVEAHSSKPALGANAIATACDLVVALSRIGADFEVKGDPSRRFDPSYSTVHVGTITGGTARNILAKQCAFHWEYRGLPEAPLDAALSAFETYARIEALPRLNRFTDKGRIETEVEVEVPGLRAEPGSAAETLALKVSRSNRTIAVPYATEAGRFQAAGIPTVVCGPGSIDQAHQPDEFIAVSEIDNAIAFMRRLISECE
jgi:acetylornithine deacetylase